MNFKAVLFILMLWLPSTAPDIVQVRQAYIEAAESEQVLKKLYDDLSSVANNDQSTLVAYKGAVTAMMARYADGFKDKKNYFKEGRDLLEQAVQKDPENVEIRCVRLSVQENVPKITGYHKEIEEDRKYILDHYEGMDDDSAKKFVKGFVQQSESFSEDQKQLF
ncbi:MAG: hypothetical protein CML04_05715 [Pseudozobellia sp.]|nr:hypothetical protein [Pseudozobellia sp.]MBG47895.1 hypothetical protein [Pseudozobellia sp.]|tara:strand:- start:85 stop:576 length:492 start_codon:yes stop_codon:yes gene_type:complete